MKKIILILLLATSLFADEYKIGDRIDPINLKDQFEKEHNITKSQKIIIIAFDKESSYIFNDFMQANNESYLENHNMLFLVDCTQIPQFVMTTFVLPKMKTYNYNTLLIQNEALSLQLPYSEEKLTILKLDNWKITKISFASSADELQNTLDNLE